jgi:hypothetical protein
MKRLNSSVPVETKRKGPRIESRHSWKPGFVEILIPESVELFMMGARARANHFSLPDLHQRRVVGQMKMIFIGEIASRQELNR